MINTKDKDSIIELYARLDDLSAKAEGGRMAISSFLTPRELHYARLRFSGRGNLFRIFGGYGDAERGRVYFLPDYMESEDTDLPACLDAFGFSHEITPLLITGSGYRNISHRDLLGSILGLGLSRDVLGDIVLLDEKGINSVAFCDSAIADFIVASLEKVANDKAKATYAQMENITLPQRRFSPIRDTVASPRLDCAVASLCSLSRAKAAEVIIGGLVELDYETEERIDRQISPPCHISVRGFGKFAVHSVADLTRKGRYRLVADKYI